MGTDPAPSWRAQVAEAARTLLPGTAVERMTLAALLLLATVLRCWDLPHIPYTHDELSALLRVDYPSLGEAIGKGVVGVDTHPPGVHAFTWAWTRLFGYGEGLVKLPFILMSLLAIVLLYRFAWSWLGGSVALVGTALLATLQYTVMYGQIARPYAFGLFTTALLADQLTRYIGSGSRRALVGITTAAVLSAWTHHFALMLATFMYVTGLFLVAREQRKAYLIAGGVAVLLYLPNVPLFIAQLGWKGLDEWLTAPGPGWILDYAWWIGALLSPLRRSAAGAHLHVHRAADADTGRIRSGVDHHAGLGPASPGDRLRLLGPARTGAPVFGGAVLLPLPDARHPGRTAPPAYGACPHGHGHRGGRGRAHPGDRTAPLWDLLPLEVRGHRARRGGSLHEPSPHPGGCARSHHPVLPAPLGH
ncbi:MAG: glycosyltransferase family 39 protein [Flavobacteriales bacterium]